MAKAGMVGLSKAAAKEPARYGIRVNVIEPDLIRTRMTEATPRSAWDEKPSEIPARTGRRAAREVAEVAAFLASEQSSYLTGNVHEVAGGRHM